MGVNISIHTDLGVNTSMNTNLGGQTHQRADASSTVPADASSTTSVRRPRGEGFYIRTEHAHCVSYTSAIA